MTASLLSRAVRCCLAAAFALSWMALAGAPAAAAVTRVYVNSPKADAVLAKPALLEVLVDRTASPEEETVEIHTRLFDAKGKAVSKKTLSLIPDKKPLKPRDDQPPGSDRLRFTGAIDPYNLAWLPKGGVAPNAQYQLQYREIVRFGDAVREGDWKTYSFWLNAVPPEPLPPSAQVVDAAAKRMQVAWGPNPAPDLVGYTLERSHDGGEWEVAQAEIAPDVTSVKDTVARYGSYRYRVVASRPAARPPEPEEENPSEAPVDEGEPGTAAEASEAPEEEEEEEEKQEPPELRSSVSPRSIAVEIGAPAAPAPRGLSGSGSGSGTGDGTGDGSGDGTGSAGTGSVPQFPGTAGGTGSSSGQSVAQPFDPQTPNISAPPGFEDTFKGPLSFGAPPREVTERVPVEIAKGGTGDDTLTVLNRAIDQERVLPPVAGGLILVMSAAHVLRYLNE